MRKSSKILDFYNSRFNSSRKIQEHSKNPRKVMKKYISLPNPRLPSALFRTVRLFFHDGFRQTPNQSSKTIVLHNYFFRKV